MLSIVIARNIMDYDSHIVVQYQAGFPEELRRRYTLRTGRWTIKSVSNPQIDMHNRILYLPGSQRNMDSKVISLLIDDLHEALDYTETIIKLVHAVNKDMCGPYSTYIPSMTPFTMSDTPYVNYPFSFLVY